MSGFSMQMLLSLELWSRQLRDANVMPARWVHISTKTKLRWWSDWWILMTDSSLYYSAFMLMFLALCNTSNRILYDPLLLLSLPREKAGWELFSGLFLLHLLHRKHFASESCPPGQPALTTSFRSQQWIIGLPARPALIGFCREQISCRVPSLYNTRPRRWICQDW